MNRLPRFCLLTALGFIVSALPALAQPAPVAPPAKVVPADPAWYADLEALTFVDGETTLPYRLLKPAQMEQGKRYPLILFLHGAGEVGTDNKKQLGNSVGEIIKRASAKGPFFLLAPQSRGWWVGVPWNLDSHVMPEKMTASMAATIKLLAEIEKAYPVDSDRIYVTGLSMGGLGTWDILSRVPDKFAAAVPVCGAADTAQAERIKHIPLWTFHGENDPVIKTQRSRDMVEALRKAGGHPIYSEVPKVSHAAWTPAYNNFYLYDWLFAQTKARGRL